MKRLILSLICLSLFGFGICQTKTLELNPAAGDEFTAAGMFLASARM